MAERSFLVVHRHDERKERPFALLGHSAQDVHAAHHDAEWLAPNGTWNQAAYRGQGPRDPCDGESLEVAMDVVDGEGLVVGRDFHPCVAGLGQQVPNRLDSEVGEVLGLDSDQRLRITRADPTIQVGCAQEEHAVRLQERPHTLQQIHRVAHMLDHVEECTHVVGFGRRLQVLSVPQNTNSPPSRWLAILQEWADTSMPWDLESGVSCSPQKCPLHNLSRAGGPAAGPMYATRRSTYRRAVAALWLR